MVKVSVVIPVYNVEVYLRQCLDSVVNQTLRDIEIVCVDDGSTDGSPAILAEYAAKDPRVKFIARPHTNAGAARNAGMSIATGEYLAFVDSDDFCDLALYEKAYAKAKSADSDLVTWRFDQYGDKTKMFSAARAFPKAMQDLKPPFSPDQMGDLLFVPLGYGPWSRMVRRELVMRHGVRFQEIERTNDVYFCCLALALSERQAIVDEVLYHYRTDRSHNLQSGNAKTPLLVISVWQAVRDGLDKQGLLGKYGKQLAMPSANSLFYTLHTIDSVSVFVEFYHELKQMYAEGGCYGAVGMQDLARNGQTQFFLSTLRSSLGAEDYLVRQLNYHRRRLADTWWSEQSLKHDFAQAKANLSQSREELEAWRKKCDELLARDGEMKADVVKLSNELSGQMAQNVHLNAELSDAKDAFRDELLRRDEAEASLRGQLTQSEETCKEQANQIIALQQQVTDVGLRILRTREELARVQSESASRISELECELDRLKRSKSYCLGRLLTWPFRNLVKQKNMRKLLKLFVPAGLMHRWLKRKYNMNVAIPGDTVLQRALVRISPYAISAIMQQRKPEDRRPRKYFFPYGKMREHVRRTYGMAVGNAKREAGFAGRIRAIMPYGLILWWDGEDARAAKNPAAPKPVAPKPTPVPKSAAPNPAVSGVSVAEFNALKAQVESVRRENGFRADTNEIIALRAVLGGFRPSVTLVLTGCYEAETVRRALEDHLKNSIYEMELLVAFKSNDEEIAGVIAAISESDSRIKPMPFSEDRLASVRSEAIAKATGDYIAFLNVNDRYSNRQMLELVVLTAAVERAKVCCGKVWTKIAGKVVYPDQITWERCGFLPSGRPPVPAGLCAAILDHKWLQSTGLRPLSSTASDDKLFLQAAEVFAGRVFCIGRTLVISGADSIYNTYTLTERDADSLAALTKLALFVSACGCGPLKSFLIEEVTNKRATELRNLVWGQNAADFKSKIMELGKSLPECNVEENFLRPLVSVVVPAYNVEKYVTRCLDSIVGQTLKSIEIIVVDDGSTDASIEIINHYASKYPNVRAVRKENGGLSSARNVGLENARGKYVGFIDSDDYVDSTMFERMSRELERHPECEFAKCGATVEYTYAVTAKEKDSSERYFECDYCGSVRVDRNVAAAMDVCAWNRLYRRSYLIENGIKYPDGASNEDEAVFFIDCCLAKNVYIFKEKFYHYLRNEGGIMAKQLADVSEKLPDAATKIYPFVAKLLIERNRRDLLGVLYRHMAGCSQRFVSSSKKREIWACLSSVLKSTDSFFYADMLPSEEHKWMLERISMLANLDASSAQVLQPPREWFPHRPIQRREKGSSIKVSFIVPVYNVERYIANTLECLRHQTLEEIEIICIDDGSIDRSGMILEAYAKTDPRISVYSQDNNGVSAARNLGLSKATGEYVAFVDGDDLPALDMAERCYNLADAHTLDAVYFDYQCFDHITYANIDHYWCIRNHRDAIPVRKVFAPDELKGLKIYGACWQYLWRRDFVRRANVEFPKIPLGEDLVWVLSMLVVARRVEAIDAVLYRYRRGNPSSAVSRLQKAGEVAPVLALKELSNVLRAAPSGRVKNLLVCRMISDILFYGERMSDARRWLYDGGFDAFGGIDSLMQIMSENDRIRLRKILEQTSNPVVQGMEIVLERVPKHIRGIMERIIELRATHDHDLIIVTGQLNSVTNEPIDSWVFFSWLQKNGIPSRYVCWKRHQFVAEMKRQNGLKDVILLEGDGVSDYEFLERCADVFPRVRAVVQENIACNSVLRWFFYLMDDVDYTFLQHGVTYWKQSQKWASSFSLANVCNVCSIREKLYLETVVPKFWMTNTRPRYVVAGLPRFELLKDESFNERQHIIFVMFTWRTTFDSGADALASSAYYAGIRRLLSEENVARIRKHNLKIVLAAHHHLANHIKNLDFGVPVEVVRTSDISTMIRKASLCITDYSSVSFDFLFLHKPVVFWTPDRLDGLLAHDDYCEVVFAEHQAGELFNRVHEVSGVLDMVERYANTNFRLEPEKCQIADSFFGNRTGICKKLYDEIA